MPCAGSALLGPDVVVASNEDVSERRRLARRSVKQASKALDRVEARLRRTIAGILEAEMVGYAWSPFRSLPSVSQLTTRRCLLAGDVAATAAVGGAAAGRRAGSLPSGRQAEEPAPLPPRQARSQGPPALARADGASPSRRRLPR